MSTSSLKAAMNELIFAKLYVDAELISGHELAEVVRDFVTADQHMRAAPSTPNASGPARVDEAKWSKLTGAVLLGTALAGHGSSKTALVDLMKALAHPSWETRRLLDMADRWLDQKEDHIV